MKRGLIIALVLALVIGVGTAVVRTQEEEVPELPGITVEDAHPQGCVDCHEGESRLSLELKEVEGHADISGMAASQEIPGLCLQCHQDLASITHQDHYRFGEDPLENGFISGYDGQCLHCHTLDPETWKMTVKSGLEK